MRLQGALVRAVEAALAIAVVAMVVCCVKFSWLTGLTDTVAGQWLDKTAPMFEGNAITYVVPRVTVPDRLDPIVGPLPERLSPSPSPTPAA